MQCHTSAVQRGQKRSPGSYNVYEEMSNEHFLNPDLGRRHKGVHLCRRLQKLDKGGQRKRLKWKTHQQAKNIIKQNQTSIFARILAFGPSKRMSQHFCVQMKCEILKSMQHTVTEATAR